MTGEPRSDETRRATTQGPCRVQGPSLFQLSFPLFLHSLITFSVMLLDTMIVSAHSLDAAAAVAIARQVLQIAFEVSTMVGIGAVIMISHALGRGDQIQARRVAAVAVVTNALFGLLIGALVAAAGPLVLHLLETPAAVAGEALAYIRIVAVAMAFNGFATAAVPCLRAFGRSRTILTLGAGVALLYVAIDTVLVLGPGPLPAFGVAGAATAVLIMRIATAALLAFVLARVLALRFSFRTVFAQGAVVRRLFALSYPSVSDYIAYGFYQLILLGLITGFGVTAVLSRTYVMIAFAFLVLVVMAIGQGNEVLLGYRQGSGDPEQAHRQGLRSAWIAAGVTSAIAGLFWLFSGPFIALFTKDAAVAALSERLLALSIAMQPGFAVNTILFQSLRAVGDVRWPALVSQATTWGLALPLAWFLCLEAGWGVEGVWYAMITEETVKAAIMLGRWNARSWKRHVLA